MGGRQRRPGGIEKGVSPFGGGLAVIRCTSLKSLLLLLVKRTVRKAVSGAKNRFFRRCINKLRKCTAGHPSRKRRSFITILQVKRHGKARFPASAAGQTSRSAGHPSRFRTKWRPGKSRNGELSTIEPSICAALCGRGKKT